MKFMKENNKTDCLKVYEERYVLCQNNKETTYPQGPQSEEAKERYEKILKKLEEGFLDQIIESALSFDYSELSDLHRTLLKSLVDGITSEVGRALVGLTCLQLTIKCITPSQSIRLHKGNNLKRGFSWRDGISMRSLDRKYNTPFLRKYELLNMNKDGVFMTRSLAENYPYSIFYKAEMRGPFKEWIKIVDAIEDDEMPPKIALLYLISLLKNRSNHFIELSKEACRLVKNYQNEKFENIQRFVVDFFEKTDYSARALEVVMHGMYQAMSEMDLLGDSELNKMSQMRSANKKHDNVGDIELSENGNIVISWDAKYGKPYLRDELEELRDKLNNHPEVEIAGFVCNKDVDLRKDIINRKIEIEQETDTKIYLFSFKEWIEFLLQDFDNTQKNELGYKWLQAIIESFAQKRKDIAPIDEPCDAWLKYLILMMKNGSPREK